MVCLQRFIIKTGQWISQKSKYDINSELTGRSYKSKHDINVELMGRSYKSKHDINAELIDRDMQ